jgi:hypothetical protein
MVIGHRLSSTDGYSPVDETGGARFDTADVRSWRSAPEMRVLRRSVVPGRVGIRQEPPVTWQLGSMDFCPLDRL